MVEELSGQLVSMAHRCRQQQELLDKIWGTHPSPHYTRHPRAQSCHPPTYPSAQVKGGRHGRHAYPGVPFPTATAAAAGNKHADSVAKRAAEGDMARAEPGHLVDASLSLLTRKATEARSKASRERIWDHVRRERRYRSRPGGKLRRGLDRVRKGLAGRFYQLLSGHKPRRCT